MPLNLNNKNISVNKKYIIRNITNRFISIGDLGLNLKPYGQLGSSIDLLGRNNFFKKPIKNLEDIEKSRDLQFAIDSGFVQIETESGVLGTKEEKSASAIPSTETKADKISIENTKKEFKAIFVNTNGSPYYLRNLDRNTELVVYESPGNIYLPEPRTVENGTIVKVTCKNTCSVSSESQNSSEISVSGYGYNENLSSGFLLGGNSLQTPVKIVYLYQDDVLELTSDKNNNVWVYSLNTKRDIENDLYGGLISYTATSVSINGLGNEVSSPSKGFFALSTYSSVGGSSGCILSSNECFVKSPNGPCSIISSENCELKSSDRSSIISSRYCNINANSSTTIYIDRGTIISSQYVNLGISQNTTLISCHNSYDEYYMLNSNLRSSNSGGAFKACVFLACGNSLLNRVGNKFTNGSYLQTHCLALPGPSGFAHLPGSVTQSYIRTSDLVNDVFTARKEVIMRGTAPFYAKVLIDDWNESGQFTVNLKNILEGNLFFADISGIPASTPFSTAMIEFTIYGTDKVGTDHIFIKRFMKYKRTQTNNATIELLSDGSVTNESGISLGYDALTNIIGTPSPYGIEFSLPLTCANQSEIWLSGMIEYYIITPSW